MKKIIIMLTLCMLFITSTFANAVNIRIKPKSSTPSNVVTWMKTYGGPGYDAINSVKQTSDGGYIFAGFTDSSGASGADIWLVKVNLYGSKQWEKTFGGPNNEFCRDIIQTSDGGYMICGHRMFNKLWLIKTDKDGNLNWEKTFQGPADSIEGRSIIQLKDGSFVVLARGFKDGPGEFPLLLKLDVNGDLLWKSSFLSSYNWAWCNQIKESQDGGFIMIGDKDYFNYEDENFYSTFLLIKTDSEGNKQWAKEFGDADKSQICEGLSIFQTDDNGYILTGHRYRWDEPEEADVWLIKTDENGNKEWDKVFDNGECEDGEYIEQTSDGGYVIVGGTGGIYKEEDRDVWLIKTDENGNKEWDRTFGGDDPDWGNEVHQTSDGGYIIGGCVNSYGSGSEDGWLIKTDKNGEIKTRVRSINSLFPKLHEKFPFLTKLLHLNKNADPCLFMNLDSQKRIYQLKVPQGR